MDTKQSKWKLLIMICFFIGPICFTEASRVPGDTCTEAFIISSLPFEDSHHTGFFEDDYSELCPDGDTAPDVVYLFIPTETITIDASLCHDETDYDSRLYVYENDCDTSNLMVCDDDTCQTGGMQWAYVSHISELELTGGNSYYFVVDGYRWFSGNYMLEISDIPIVLPTESPNL